MVRAERFQGALGEQQHLTVDILDAKCSVSVKLAHRVQVTFYAHLLQFAFDGLNEDRRASALPPLRVGRGGVWIPGSVPASGPPIPGASPYPGAVAPSYFDLDQHMVLLHSVLSTQLRRVGNGPNGRPWLLAPSCHSCEYLERCEGDAREEGRLTQLPGVGSSDLLWLEDYVRDHRSTLPAPVTDIEALDLLTRTPSAGGAAGYAPLSASDVACAEHRALETAMRLERVLGVAYDDYADAPRPVPRPRLDAVLRHAARRTVVPLSLKLPQLLSAEEERVKNVTEEASLHLALLSDPLAGKGAAGQTVACMSVLQLGRAKPPQVAFVCRIFTASAVSDEQVLARTAAGDWNRARCHFRSALVVTLLGQLEAATGKRLVVFIASHQERTWLLDALLEVALTEEADGLRRKGERCLRALAWMPELIQAQGAALLGRTIGARVCVLEAAAHALLVMPPPATPSLGRLLCAIRSLLHPSAAAAAAASERVTLTDTEPPGTYAEWQKGMRVAPGDSADESFKRVESLLRARCDYLGEAVQGLRTLAHKQLEPDCAPFELPPESSDFTQPQLARIAFIAQHESRQQLDKARLARAAPLSQSRTASRDGAAAVRLQLVDGPAEIPRGAGIVTVQLTFMALEGSAPLAALVDSRAAPPASAGLGGAAPAVAPEEWAALSGWWMLARNTDAGRRAARLVRSDKSFRSMCLSGTGPPDLFVVADRSAEVDLASRRIRATIKCARERLPQSPGHAQGGARAALGGGSGSASGGGLGAVEFLLLPLSVDWNTEGFVRALTLADKAALGRAEDALFWRLVNDPVRWGMQRPAAMQDGAAEAAESECTKLNLTASQRTVFLGCIQNQLQCVWGPPGCGKVRDLPPPCLLHAINAFCVTANPPPMRS